MINIVPCTQREAFRFVGLHHRHNKPPRGAVFTLAAEENECPVMVGVAIAGRPVARGLQDGVTLEVTRCCVLDDAPKGTCSALYGACWRAARALGWRRLVTYTLQAETGASLRGAGWKVIGERKARDPVEWQNRPARALQDVIAAPKYLWQAQPC